MTLREMIIRTLTFSPYSYGSTASQIFHYVNTMGWGGKDPVKLSSLSSQLNKMVDEGVLDVLTDLGPRGGNGYVLKEGRIT